MKAFGEHQLLAGGAVALPLEKEFPASRFAGLESNGNINGTAAAVGFAVTDPVASRCWKLRNSSALHTLLGGGAYKLGTIGTPGWRRRWPCKSDDTTSSRTAAAWSSQNITVPHLSGIFLNIDRLADVWTEQEWRTDLTAMKDVGIEFFIVHHVARATSQPASAACPLGYYEAYYHMPKTSNGCVQSKAGRGGSAMSTVLDIAAELDLGVYLGVGMTATPLFTAHGRSMNSTTLAQYTALCEGIARSVWGVYGAKHGSTIHGWYTMLEEWNDGKQASKHAQLAPMHVCWILCVRDSSVSAAQKLQACGQVRRRRGAASFCSRWPPRSRHSQAHQSAWLCLHLRELLVHTTVFCYA